jgi:hypothetical protein
MGESVKFASENNEGYIYHCKHECWIKCETNNHGKIQHEHIG